MSIKMAGPMSAKCCAWKWTLSDPGPFSDDLATLLDAEVWRSGNVQQAVEQLQEQLKARKQVAEIISIKKPLVEQFQLENGIAPV